MKRLTKVLKMLKKWNENMQIKNLFRRTIETIVKNSAKMYLNFFYLEKNLNILLKIKFIYIKQFLYQKKNIFSPFLLHICDWKSVRLVDFKRGIIWLFLVGTVMRLRMWAHKLKVQKHRVPSSQHHCTRTNTHTLHKHTHIVFFGIAHDYQRRYVDNFFHSSSSSMKAVPLISLSLSRIYTYVALLCTDFAVLFHQPSK